MTGFAAAVTSAAAGRRAAAGLARLQRRQPLDERREPPLQRGQPVSLGPDHVAQLLA